MAHEEMANTMNLDSVINWTHIVKVSGKREIQIIFYDLLPSNDAPHFRYITK